MKKKSVRRRKKNDEPELIPKGWFKAAGFIFLGLISFYFLKEPLIKLAAYTNSFPYLTHKAEEWLDVNSIHKIRPDGFEVYGIDVSHHQADIEWEQLRKEKIAFIFMKATEGINHQDRYFDKHWDAAWVNGIMRGAYHFYLPAKDAKEQALNFKKKVSLRYGDLPPVLDVEVTNHRKSAEIREGVQTWLNEIESAYNIKPIIYTNYSFYHEHLAGHFDDYPLWIAHYGKKDMSRDEKTRWQFWQHSESGRLKGVKGNVDCNVFNGTMEELEGLCYMPAEPDSLMY